MMALLPGFVNRRVQAAEYDLAGVVVDGNGTELKEGDEVFGSIPVGEYRSSLSSPMFSLRGQSSVVRLRSSIRLLPNIPNLN